MVSFKPVITAILRPRPIIMAKKGHACLPVITRIQKVNTVRGCGNGVILSCIRACHKGHTAFFVHVCHSTTRGHV